MKGGGGICWMISREYRERERVIIINCVQNALCNVYNIISYHITGISWKKCGRKCEA